MSSQPTNPITYLGDQATYYPTSQGGLRLASGHGPSRGPSRYIVSVPISVSCVYMLY